MPVDSTNAMPSSTSRSEVAGRPVRPCTAGLRGGSSDSTSARNSSLISRGGGGDADDGIASTLHRRPTAAQSLMTYLRNVCLAENGFPGDQEAAWSAYDALRLQ